MTGGDQPQAGYMWRLSPSSSPLFCGDWTHVGLLSHLVYTGEAGCLARAVTTV